MGKSVMGQSIRELRKAAGVTQAEFAAALGVEQATVSRWERGTMLPADKVFAILDFAKARGIEHDLGTEFQPFERTKIPIVGTVEDDCVVQFYDLSNIDESTRQYANTPIVNFDARGIALLVQTMDMSPYIPWGAVIYIQRSVPFFLKVPTDLALLEFVGKRSFIGEILGKPDGAKYFYSANGKYGWGELISVRPVAWVQFKPD